MATSRPVTAALRPRAFPSGAWLRRQAAGLPLLIVGVGTLLGILVINLAEAALPVSSDQALYSLIGQAIRHGAVPYRDFPDMKSPGIFYVRAVLDSFGASGWSGACVGGPLQASCGWLGVKLADLATTLLLGVTLYAAARRLRLERGAALAAAAVGSAYVSLTYVSQLGLTPEKLAVCSTTLALLLAAAASEGGHVRTWLWLAAGAAVALAVLMKQPSGTALLPLAVLAAWSARQPRARLVNIGLVVAGFVIPLALVAALLASQNALAALFEYAVSVNLERIRTPASLDGFGGDTAGLAAWQAFKGGLGPFWFVGLAGVLASAMLPRPARGVLVLWLATDTLLLLRLREFMQLAPSVALLGGWAMWRLWRAAAQPPHLGLGGPGAARTFLLAGLASLVLLSASYQESLVMRVVNDRLLRDHIRSPDEFVVDELYKLPPGPLFVWGNGAELYLLAGRRPAASNLNAIALSANLPGTPARRARLMRQLQANPPTVIALSPEVDRAGAGLTLGGFAELKALLDSGYTSMDTVSRDAKFGGWRLYVSKETRPT